MDVTPDVTALVFSNNTELTSQSTKYVTAENNSNHAFLMKQFLAHYQLIHHEPFTFSQELIFQVLYGVIIVLAVMANTGIVVVICRNKPLRTVTNTFLASLAIGDIIIALVNMPVQLHMYLENSWDLNGEVSCKMVHYIQGITIVASMLTMLAISIDRYQAIIHPLKSRHIQTTNKACLAVLVIWVTSGVLLVPQAIIQGLHVRLDTYAPDFKIVYVCVEKFPHRWMRVMYSIAWYVLIYVVPVVVISVSYSCIACRLHLRQTVGHRLQSHSQSHHNQYRQKKKVFRMLVVIVTVFVCCWMPFFSMQLFALDHIYTTAFRNMAVILHLIGYCNTVLNPLVYLSLNDTFRHYAAMFWKSQKTEDNMNQTTGDGIHGNQVTMETAEAPLCEDTGDHQESAI